MTGVCELSSARLLRYSVCLCILPAAHYARSLPRRLRSSPRALRAISTRARRTLKILPSVYRNDSEFLARAFPEGCWPCVLGPRM
ncbi:hypothetical protein C8J57DRAFT_1304495 [Mycena rebaudengoi]|nr:hypothetical protein C8J57DRAFT_1304495 [Mycena rebaudengoi]